MGRCITVITFGGVTSLGLLTGSLLYESLQNIPELIRSLNTQDSFHTQEGKSVLKKIKSHFSISNIVNLALAVLSTSAFRTAYKCSGSSGKHPYLIYSALGAPLALLTLFYKGGKPLMPIAGVLKTYFAELKAAKTKKSNKNESKGAAAAAGGELEPEPLELSYVNISESSSSSDSSAATPEDSSLSNSAFSIEEEVENALQKKERIYELDTIRSAFSVASYIAGAAFAISSVGFVGDRYFI